MKIEDTPISFWNFLTFKENGLWDNDKNEYQNNLNETKVECATTPGCTWLLRRYVMQVVMLGWGIFGISQSPAGMFLAFHHSILGPYYGDNEGRDLYIVIKLGHGDWLSFWFLLHIGKVLAKLCKHISMRTKLFQRQKIFFSKKRKKKSHFPTSGNPAPNRGWKLYDMMKVIHDYVVHVLLIQAIILNWSVLQVL